MRSRLLAESLREWAGRVLGRPVFWVLAVIVVGSTLLHYHILPDKVLGLYAHTRHTAERIFFILPVVGATFAFGQAGGLFTLVMAVLIMIPRALFMSLYPIDALVEVTIVAVVGYLVMWMHESHRRMVTRLRTVNAVTDVLTESMELDQILNNVLIKILDVMNVGAGAIFLLDKEEQGLTLIAHQNLPPEMIEGVTGLKSARMIARYSGIKCRLAVPLQAKGETNGLLIVGDAKPCPGLCRESELLTTICHEISVVVENALLYEDIERQVRVERYGREVVEEVTSELELGKVLPKVIQIAERLVEADGGIVALWDEDRQVVTYPYLHNLPRRLARITVSREQGLAGEVITTGLATVVDDYPNYARAVPEFKEAGVTSVAAVPIASGERIFGALGVVSVRKAKSFLDRDIAILTQFGRQAGVAVENAYLYENLRFYARRITQAQENERKRIARELHDDTIQSLIALSRRLEALTTSGEQLPWAAVERVKDLWAQTDDLIQRVRRFSQDLRPSILDDLGLLPALEELTTDLDHQPDLQAEFLVIGARRRFSSEVELTLFRIAQEALSNVRKHARATRVVTTLELTDSAIRVTVEDDGMGFRPPELAEGLATEGQLGLMGMHERVRLLGGTLAIESGLGRGTKVTARVPN